MPDRTGSILAADFGSVTTRVVLIDIVDGVYRLVAQGEGRTTIGYPVDDVTVGLRRVLNTITEQTGRKFTHSDDALIIPEQSDRAGVDHFVATASAGRVMRAVLVGLIPGVTLSSAQQAVMRSYVEVVATLHLSDGRDEQGRLNAILLNQPDLIFVAGGTEGGNKGAMLEMMNVVRLAIDLIETPRRPIVIYAGNRDLVPDIRQRFEDLPNLLVAGNVRPGLNDERPDLAAHQLEQAFDWHKEHQGGGFQNIASMSSTGVLPTAQSYATLVRYFAAERKANVLAVDMGSSTAFVVSAVNGLVDTTISTDFGLGYSAPGLLSGADDETFRRWLPFPMHQRERNNYGLNKALRPATIPNNRRDLYIEQAMLRAGIQTLLARARKAWPDVPAEGPLPPINLIIAGGKALTQTGDPVYDAMLILDAVQPAGVTEILADTSGIAPALGATASVVPRAVVQLLQTDALQPLGTVIAPVGQPTPGKTAMTLKLTDENGATFQRDIEGGQFVQLPLPRGSTLELRIRLAGGWTLNGKSRLKQSVSGGAAGLIIDTRGRPLMPSADVAERARQIVHWERQATGHDVPDIPADWLVMPEEDQDDEQVLSLPTPTSRADETTSETDDLDDFLADDEREPEPAASAQRPRRRGLFGRGRKAAEPTLDERLSDLEEFEGLLDDMETREADDTSEEAKPRKRNDGARLRRRS